MSKRTKFNKTRTKYEPLEPQLDDILNLYAKNPGAELEIKVRLATNKVFMNTFEKYIQESGSFVVEQSINLISGHNRKESYYADGKKVSQKFVEKIRLKDVLSKSFKISLSTEEPGDPTVPELARFKNRISLFDVPGFDGWRLDFTIIKTIEKKDFGNLKNYVKTLMAPLTENNFIDRIPGRTKTDSFEFEIECIGDPENIRDVIENLSETPSGIDLSDVAKKTKLYGNNLKQLLNNPIQLTSGEYQKLIPKLANYYLSDKTDGARCLVLFPQNQIITMRESIIYKFKHKIEDELIVDAEILNLENSDFEQILVFDILYMNGSVINKSYTERLELLNGIKWPDKMTIKTTVKLTDYRKQIPKHYNRSVKLYPNDGLIFTEDVDYNGAIYKWKPPEQMTIDFYIVKPDPRLIGVPPHVNKPKQILHFLFCGIQNKYFNLLNMKYMSFYKDMVKIPTNSEYFPIPFAPSSNQFAYIFHHPEDISGHIGEFGYDGEWVLHNMRLDKDVLLDSGISFGNDFRVAESIWNSYNTPLTLMDLTGDVTEYFQKNKSDFYRPMINFNSFVKAQVLRQVSNANLIVDLASGKGQDLFMYHGYGVNHGIFIDIDAPAIEKLNERKFDLDKKELHIYNYIPGHKMKIETKVADASEVVLDVQADAVIMNLAIHYIISDYDRMVNFVNNVDSMLKTSGLFIFTCFDGRRLDEILDRYNGDLKIRQSGKLKYHLIKKYKSMDYGSVISVKQPFSDEPMDEFIIDIEWVLDEFRDRGYIVLQNGTFLDWINKYKSFNQKKYDRMSDADRLYSSFYSYVTVCKM